MTLLFAPHSAIRAQAGTRVLELLGAPHLDSRLRGNDEPLAVVTTRTG